ncbi:MAG: hypothetical protein ACM30H_04160 [Clostridia bacterium]
MIRRLALLAPLIAALWSGSAAPADVQQPPLKDVTSVRLANYGAPSAPIHSREDLRAVLEELRQLRGKTWRRGDTKLECYSSVTLMHGNRILTVFRVTPDTVVERIFSKGQATSFSQAIDPNELLKTSALLAEAPPAKGCATAEAAETK